MSQQCICKESEMAKIKKENKSLKETCNVLSDSNIMVDIKKSLKQIKKGNYIPLSRL